MKWYDVTPRNWSIASRYPYVFGRALAALAGSCPGGLRLTGEGLYARTTGDERAGELRGVVHRAIWESRRHQRTFQRIGKLMVEVTLGMGAPPEKV